MAQGGLFVVARGDGGRAAGLWVEASACLQRRREASATGIPARFLQEVQMKTFSETGSGWHGSCRPEPV